MISQLRIYTINQGMMESWTKLFTEKIVPIHRKHGMSVEQAWINKANSEFVWIRSFANAQEMEQKSAAWLELPERKALGNEPNRHIAKMDVRVIDQVNLN